MALPGETVQSGAALEACEDCGDVPTLAVYRSAAGWYVGYACCSPYSRESAYYGTEELAAKALEYGSYYRL